VSEQRRERLRRVVAPLLVLDDFTKDHAQETCHEVSPAYVTQTIKDLIRDQFLQVIEVDAVQRFRWTDRRNEFVLDNWIDGLIHGVQVTATPEEDRPRERLIRDGAHRLSDADLLAILIRSGIKGESAIIGGGKVASRFAHRLDDLAGASLAEVRAITKSVNIANYAQIMAGIELGRRIATIQSTRIESQTKITSTASAIEYCQNKFARLAIDGVQEEFHIVTLDTKHKPIATHQITVGTLDASLVHSREVFRAAIRDAASAILLVHNHPSGDPTPSREDLQVTDRLTEVGKIVGITVLDHIIVARQRSLSIQEER
jgi:DNA repair protein RadC